MTGNVISRGSTLCRIGEADLIDVVLVGDDVNRAGRGGQHEDAVFKSLSANGDAGAGGNGAGDHLGTPVENVIKGIDGLFRVMLIILEVELDNGFASLGVDFSNLSTVLNGNAVISCRTGQRAGTADLDRIGRGQCGHGDHSETKRGNDQFLHMFVPPVEVGSGNARLRLSLNGNNLTAGIISQIRTFHKICIVLFFMFSMKNIHVKNE